ncbi:hypothetical protein NEOLEDRAFT_1175393 [Neolentinus lepideus HHB14362 ss-1]|uniref:Uncharacterized protein n=1 Tax=Neolentinus lepideus HHB14362 ss-1 TaxID=1314782 RepID=A0A165V2T5_9AGAM|nr:hypothetical protein NEOLEDRAFT_1175393 [Neolentinus lepideus HHB14362 ss-1]
MVGASQQAADKSEKKRGKQPKKFVDQRSAAIELALSAAEIQEGKSREKVEKRKQALVSSSFTSPLILPLICPPDLQKAIKSTKEGSSKSSGKVKIKEKKAIIAAQKAQKKKEKVKARKETKGAGNRKEKDGRAGESSNVEKRADPVRARKRVSFA